jgi:two-component system sensor histidine kinase VicK
MVRTYSYDLEVCMFFRTLQWRLVSFFCLIAFCLIIPIGLFLNNRVEDRYYREFKDGIDKGFLEWKLDINENTTTGQIYSNLRDGGEASLFYIFGEHKSYTVVNMKNIHDFFTSDSKLETGDKTVFINELLDSENFIRALGGEDGGVKKLKRYGERDYFDYARPVGNFVLYFRYYKDGWQPVIDSFSRIILSSLLIAFIIAFILGYTLSKTVTVPIVRLMHKARKIAAGDFEQVLDVRSDDEIGKLTNAFNHMTKSLKNTLIEISSEKNKIETILNYMTDGVVAFNLKGEVIHTNPASRQLLGDGESYRTFNEYAAIYGLNIKMEDILYIGDFSSSEIKLTVDEKTLRVYFAVFTDESGKPGGIIAVLQDITEQQKLENMRREFVANVSHELRTPLTSIKSYSETLLEGALEDRETAERFLRVINSETDRMTRLVKDLLQLSSIENRQVEWNMEEICFEELVRDSVEKVTLEARNKCQQLECFTIGEIPAIKGDYDRIEQVVLNILSNAIKYTHEGGKVSVYVGKSYGNVYVKVADTGIGIPEQDMPRIFERFYRVDKARSREMGGTGLGLAIAKEIVEAHGGEISIKSVLGKGTEVTIRFPAARDENEVACNLFLNGT